MSGVRSFVVLLFAVFTFVAGNPADAADKKALVGGRLIDGLLGEPIANSVILIDGDTIEAIGTVDTLEIPASYEVNVV